MEEAAKYVTTYGPIIVVILPTLLVGMTKAPKKGDGATAWIKFVLQLLSVVTHHDQPGTFKLPVTAKMHPKEPAADKPADPAASTPPTPPTSPTTPGA